MDRSENILFLWKQDWFRRRFGCWTEQEDAILKANMHRSAGWIKLHRLPDRSEGAISGRRAHLRKAEKL